MKNPLSKEGIELDVLRVDAEIANKKIYDHSKDEGVILKYYSKENQNEKYMSKIENDIEYIGTLSDRLSKEGYGYYKYVDKPHEYYGNWKNDNKDGYGMYIYKDTKDIELYIGEWNAGLKKGNGIYIWTKDLKEANPGNKNTLNLCSSYDFFLGNFEKDKFVNGSKGKISFDENGKHFSFYLGNYNDGGYKEDKNGLIIEDDKVFYGEIKNDNLIQGRIHIYKDRKREKSYKFETKKDTKDEYNFSMDLDDKPDDITIDNNYKKFLEENLIKKIEDIYEQLINETIVKFKDFDNLNDNRTYTEFENLVKEIKKLADYKKEP